MGDNMEECDKTNFLDSIKSYLNGNKFAYTVLKRVTPNKDCRQLSILCVFDGQIIDITYLVSNILDYPQSEITGAMIVKGKRKDMGLYVIRKLSSAIGFRIKTKWL